MRVLLVEDSDRLRRSLSEGLRGQGYALDAAADGEEGLHLALTENYDVVVLDIMLPKLDGLQVLRRMRDGSRDSHVLLLTARDTVADRVWGLRSGADDYLTKPFAFEELVARIEVLVRRRHQQKHPNIRIGSIEIELSAKVVRKAGARLSLRPREYALLEYLALRRGSLVTRSDIESHIYAHDAELMSNVVDSAVCALRKKIDSPSGPSLIETRRGMGYVFGPNENAYAGGT